MALNSRDNEMQIQVLFPILPQNFTLFTNSAPIGGLIHRLTHIKPIPLHQFQEGRSHMNNERGIKRGLSTVLNTDIKINSVVQSFD